MFRQRFVKAYWGYFESVSVLRLSRERKHVESWLKYQTKGHSSATWTFPGLKSQAPPGSSSILVEISPDFQFILFEFLVGNSASD